MSQKSNINELELLKKLSDIREDELKAFINSIWLEKIHPIITKKLELDSPFSDLFYHYIKNLLIMNNKEKYLIREWDMFWENNYRKLVDHPIYYPSLCDVPYNEDTIHVFEKYLKHMIKLNMIPSWIMYSHKIFPQILLETRPRFSRAEWQLFLSAMKLQSISPNNLINVLNFSKSYISIITKQLMKKNLIKNKIELNKANMDLVDLQVEVILDEDQAKLGINPEILNAFKTPWTFEAHVSTDLSKIFVDLVLPSKFLKNQEIIQKYFEAIKQLAGVKDIKLRNIDNNYIYYTLNYSYYNPRETRWELPYNNFEILYDLYLEQGDNLEDIYVFMPTSIKEKTWKKTTNIEKLENKHFEILSYLWDHGYNSIQTVAQYFGYSYTKTWYLIKDLTDMNFYEEKVTNDFGFGLRRFYILLNMQDKIPDEILKFLVVFPEVHVYRVFENNSHRIMLDLKINMENTQDGLRTLHKIFGDKIIQVDEIYKITSFKWMLPIERFDNSAGGWILDKNDFIV